MGSPVPQGTGECQGPDVDSGILISIQDKPTLGTHMCPGRERFLHSFPTARAILAGILWGNCYHFYPMHHGIGLHPAEELSPGCIMDTLSQLVVLDHVPYLKVFVGNQVVRRDKRVRRFPSEIFTLPLDLQIGFRQLFPGFLTIS